MDMMTVKFLTDFRGKLTREAFYQAGEMAEFEPAIAAQLIAEGRAELVEISEELNKPAKRKRK